ncbi:hypothetical protein PYW08_006258 [Mythimna loreyi]|uniref:Uncharacterized protein n=1 Tax=Mythimna loreyi TaxID=667449 RepID=A0ACC2QM49_9NEOP|nr:hypothetical protein PYW08_006258 [Mythimna loreyi]
MIATCENTNQDVLNKLPKFTNVKSSLYRFRNKAAGVEKLCCKEAGEVQIPSQYQDFVLADYAENGLRIIVFCSKTAKHAMTEISEFSSDGTFKSCTQPFSQLYSIHGDLGSTVNNTNILLLVYTLS